jgi:hypothetical protein
LSKSDDDHPTPKNKIKKSPSGGGGRRPTGDVGSALKSAYQRTLDEDIPPEMLDLLGKLD